jgi:tetratricopeptide (TPR) repeat protein
MLVAPSHLRHGAEHLFGREQELATLDAALSGAADWRLVFAPPSPDAASRITHHAPRPHVLSIIAWGGVGKTALVIEWMNRLSTKDWPGLERVFDWSFYSQGTRETGTASADTFVREALIFFGDTVMAAGNETAERKGVRLAELVAQRPTLLVVDGLEPLQAPKTGELRDPAVRALLLGLARHNPGLCVLTSRQRVDDLKPGLDTVTPELQLEHLEDTDGARLLDSLGVRKSGGAPIQDNDPELIAASRESGGHALTLHLLGTYLAEAHGGDVRRRDRVDLAKADDATKRDEHDTYGHAFKVMAAYEKWLAGGTLTPAGVEGQGEGARRQRQLALLRLMGFFERPAAPDCLGALVAAPPIPGLTQPLRDLTEADWNTAVNGLVKLGLVKTAPWEPRRFRGYSQERAQFLPLGEPQDFTPPSALAPRHCPLSTLVDAHPLLREYFARRLREGIDGSPGLGRSRTPEPPKGGTTNQPPEGGTPNEAWREGHRRLYEHLKASVPYWPEGLDGLQPLYQAVAHGCHAGLHQQACEEVYRDRILRGTGYAGFYSTKKLGAFGADLGAVACFFEEPWTRLVPTLSEADQAWLLNEAAFRLRALGRLGEALEPMRAGQDARVGQEGRKEAARGYSNVSELELTLGEVTAAVRDAEQSVAFADRGTDAFERMSDRTNLADALHQAGRRPEALVLFREAEAMQVQDQPEYPLLYSVSGFLYCDLLLAEAERAAWQCSAGVSPAGLPGVPPGGSGGETLPEPAAGTAALLQSCRAVEQRAAQTLKWAEDYGKDILSTALDRLTLGRAALHAAILENSPLATRHPSPATRHPSPSTRHPSPVTRHPSSATRHSSLATCHSSLADAVDGLRAAGTTHHVPRGLLTRAWCSFAEAAEHRRRGEHTKAADCEASARADLDEARQIAERGPMRLHLADIHLHRARLFHATSPYPWNKGPDGKPRGPKDDLAAARALIEQCGYWRRKEELEDAEAAAQTSCHAACRHKE